MNRDKKCKKAPERVLFCVLRRWGMQDDVDKMRAVLMHRPLTLNASFDSFTFSRD